MHTQAKPTDALADLPRFLTLREVATVARCPLSTAKFWYWSGRLPGQLVGRRVLVLRDDLEAMLLRGVDCRQNPPTGRRVRARAA